jgi:autotransporter-associated beta strand protein
MKTQPELNNTPARFKALARLTPKAALLALALAGLPNTSQADTSWTGANSTAWTDSGNWNNGLPGPGNGVIFINNISVNTPTLTTSVSAGWDIYIGQNGNTGALNQNAGTLATGSGNWAFIGVDAGSVGTYNLTGSASFSASRINLGCWWNNTSHSSGTININTTGTVDAYGTVGDWWQNDSWHVGVDPGNTGTINLTNGTVHSYANMWLGAFSGSGTFNQYGGTNNVGGNLAIARYWNGSIGVSTGRYNISGGTLNAASTSLAYSGGSGDVEDAQLNVSGTGTVNNEGDLVVAVGGNSASVSAVSIATGGTLNVATTTKRWMIVNQYDTVQGTLNVNGGTLNLNANTDLRFSTGNGSGTSAVILNGGTITSWSGNQTGAGSGVLDLNQAGGSSANNTFSLNGGTLTIAQVTANQASGTRVFNFNGGTLKPTGNNANFMQGLSAANVQANGAIIDTAGNNITIAQALADGGGGGGLTKLGNGTLTLSGSVGYTGPTRVLGGTLSLNSVTGLPSPGGDLVVSNATLTLDASGGTAMSANNVSVGSTLNLALNPTANAISAAGNLTLGDNTTINLAYGTVTANPSAAAINASGSLTKGTNIVINISATGLGTSPVIPLIVVGSGTVNTNGFVLGTLPSGVKGVLTNSTSTSLDLRITSAGQLLSWHGANAGNTVVLTNWDINASSNWYDTGMNLTRYLQYSGNTIGDNVIFGDNGYAYDGTNYVYLAGTVVPATVEFSSSSPYILTGPGGIGGATSLVLTNMNNSVVLGTANSYTGGTVVGGGTLVIANDNALGATSGGVTLAGGTLELNAGVTSSRATTVTANSGIGVVGGATAQWNGSLTGAGGLTKTDNGTLTLAAVNSFTGPTVVNAGTLNLTGTITPGTTTVGGAAGNAVLNISGNLTSSNLFVGNASGAVGAVYQTAGTVTLSGGTEDMLNVGNMDASFGYYNAMGGTLNVAGISIGGENNPNVWPPQGTGDGIMEVRGATINNNGWITMARGGNAQTGILNVYSGSLTYSGGGIGCNWQFSGSGQTSIINIMGGSVTSTNQGVYFRAADTGILNLNGGLLKGTGVAGYGILNFNGGTLRSAANTTDFIGVTRATVYSGGATIDDGGNTVTIRQALAAPNDYGVSGITFTAGGSGYVAPPIVTLYNGSGSNATAVASISGGSVTGFTITSPGTGFSPGDTVSVGLSGGGANVTPPTVTGVTLTAAPLASGGLTKQGAGTLTLSAVNTYTGATLVNNGTLMLAGPPLLHLSFDNVSGKAVINSGTGGSAMNGTLSGTAVITTGGRFGNALSIGSGAADAGYVLIPNSVVPLNTSGNWTVAMWINTSTAGGVYAYQGDGGWGWGNTTFHLNNGSSGGAGAQAGGVRWGEGWERGTASLTDGAWHFVVMTCSAGTKVGYVDGSVDSWMEDDWNNVGNGGQFWIGGTPDTGDGDVALNGLIDEVYVFDRAISLAEVQSLYNNNALPGSPSPVLPGAVTVAAGATLGGNGSIGGPVTVQPGGTISPGASIGTLFINNNLTLGGNLVAEVNTSVSPSNDLIVVTGTLANSGTGTVTLSNLGPALVAGDSFTLFSKPLANGGAMSLITTPALTSGLVLSNRLALDGSVLVVSSGSLPSNPTNVTYSVSNNTLTLGWPLNYTGWLLQSNSVGIASTNSWFVVPESSATNGMSFTVDPAKKNVFYRLQHP